MSAGTSIQDVVLSLLLNTSDDAFAPTFTFLQREILRNYMQPFELAADLTLEFTLALGAVIARRMANRSRRVAVI